MRKNSTTAGKSLTDTFVVTPAQVGTQQFVRLMDSGSLLRRGKNDDFRWQEAFSAAC
jgi:hypothetical protein